MANIGYIQVSLNKQNTGRQFEYLKDWGIKFDKIFEEKVSGKDAKNRPQLQAMLNYIHEGDTVYVLRSSAVLPVTPKICSRLLHNFKRRKLH